MSQSAPKDMDWMASANSARVVHLSPSRYQGKLKLPLCGAFLSRFHILERSGLPRCQACFTHLKETR